MYTGRRKRKRSSSVNTQQEEEEDKAKEDSENSLQIRREHVTIAATKSGENRGRRNERVVWANVVSISIFAH